MTAQSTKLQNLLTCIKTCDPDMTVRQMALLALIGTETTTVREAARVMDVSKPVVTRGTYALIRKGFVTKTVNTKDRRVVFLTITDTGRKFLDQLPF